MPHGGDWREAGTVRLAEALNQPFVALVDHFHPGVLPASASFVSGGEGSVVVSVVKQAEDSDDFVMRAYEAHGIATVGRFDLAFLGRSFEASFTPGEVRTFPRPV